MEFLALIVELNGQGVQRRVKSFQFKQRRQSHRSREDVIGGLAIINVVIGMRVRVLAELASEQLGGTVGDDFVGVHVEADSSSGLKYIDNERVVPLSVLDRKST